MEGIHGVDVSWLHRTNRGHRHRLQAPSSPGLTRDPPPPTSRHSHPPAVETTPQKPISNGGPVQTPGQNLTPQISLPQPPPATAPPATTPPAQKSTPKRPGLLSRNSSEKSNTLGTPEKSGIRRGSWISSISSKFSSSNPATPPAAGLTNGQAGTPQTNDAKTTPPISQTNAVHAATVGATPKKQHTEEVEELEPYCPQPPKSGGTSFFSSALRRLSSSQAANLAKTVPHGGMCPRKVMNIDPNRERCLVPELEQAKLRRVAFCVDVEIAGGPRYKDEVDDDVKKEKKKKIKEKGEGEALKHPEAVAAEKDKQGVIQASGEEVGTEDSPNPEGTVLDEKKEPSRKKEKKKRSEAERKERKEKKRRKAEENGMIPLELSRVENGNESPPSQSGASTPRPSDKPTTDPLRIYRRCCQLRETPILKRITEQLGKQTECVVENGGVVPNLDLTGSRLQRADVGTLGDWLAVVPVRRLILEDSDLTDEEVRVILAGLLAAKTPEFPVRRRKHDSHDEKPGKIEEKLGVVEKLSLKNNPKVSRDGWKHISLFIYMCRSLKAIDVSMIPFPVQSYPPAPTSPGGAEKPRKEPSDAAEILSKALSERLAGSRLEELVMGECALTSHDIQKIIYGVTVCGVKRLCLAGNSLEDEGLEYVVRYLRSGVCQGLDLGGNDLRDRIDHLCRGLHEKCPLWALSLADCNLSPKSIRPLLPALCSLPDFRFIDLSHNRDLFGMDPSALGTLRKYLPRLPILKRIHLCDVSMSPAQAIGLAEVLPESPHLAHLNIMENPELQTLAKSSDEASQEEACALYASLMAAVRVSETIICIDVDVPSAETSEVVKALAKQVVAYCLRNMERCTASATADDSETGIPNATIETNGLPDKGVEVPEVLLHLVGNVEGFTGNLEDYAEPAPDDDYIVGGTGVVKALSYCLLEKASERRRRSAVPSGTVTPTNQVGDMAAPAKAKTMSKNLLDSARKIRERLRPAMIRESRKGDDMSYRRLLFLDQTLQGMIQRFEDEYPECRISSTADSFGRPIPPANALSTSQNPSEEDSASISNSLTSSISNLPSPPGAFVDAKADLSDDEDVDANGRPLLRSRHNSDVSLASRALSLEEGRIHRLGQTLRRDLLKPELEDHHHGTTGNEKPQPQHIQALRDKLFEMTGPEIRDAVERNGWEETFRQIGENAEELRVLGNENPEEFRAFREAQLVAQRNAYPKAAANPMAVREMAGDENAIED